MLTIHTPNRLLPAAVLIDLVRGVHTLVCVRCRTMGPTVKMIEPRTVSQLAHEFQGGHKCKPA